ncbi:cell division protein ZapA [Desulfovibrio sp. OttesenSCG-928-A18]|nr:cell division protein ZapA [Desulfovibrio sp. OttesenSCG-928-A18]
MRSHTVIVLGVELSFKSDASPRRIEQARALIDERYAGLARHSGQISKEKLLALLALSLADDIVMLREERTVFMKKIEELLGDIEKVAG